MGMHSAHSQGPQAACSKGRSVVAIPDFEPASDLLVSEWLQLQSEAVSWKPGMVGDDSPASDNHCHGMTDLCLPALELSDLLQIVIPIHRGRLDEFVEPV